MNNAALTVPGRPPRRHPGARAPGPRRRRPRRAHHVDAPGSFLDFPLKGYRLHFQIGLFASYRLMQLVLPDMIELGRGGIVNISSLAAFVPGPGSLRAPGRTHGSRVRRQQGRACTTSPRPSRSRWRRTTSR